MHSVLSVYTTSFLFLNFLFDYLIFSSYWSVITNSVLVSCAQQSDSVKHIHVSVLFLILLPFRSLQNTEQSLLCYTGGPCWLSVLNTAVYTCHSQTPNLSLP